jgi:hypothetical protein
MEFRYISDPGHGWLEVPLSLVDTLGIRSEISHYSFMNGNMAYLEEDLDAGILLQALMDQGFKPKINDVYQEYTQIRNYTRF